MMDTRTEARAGGDTSEMAKLSLMSRTWCAGHLPLDSLVGAVDKVFAPVHVIYALKHTAASIANEL